MADSTDKPGSTGEGGFTLLPRSLDIKVGILIGLSVIIAAGFIIYVLYARGTFEQTQRLYLITDNAEGVTVGSNLIFAGFPIGRVRRITLRPDGKVRISVRVPVDDARWLRETSVFILDVPLIGGVKLRAYSSNLQDPPLPDRAERTVLRGDTAKEIPEMVAALRNILESLEGILQAGSSLQQTLQNARAVSDRMAGRQGILGAALGSEENARKVLTALDRANALLARLDGVALKMDTVLTKTDQRVLSQGGLVDETQKAVVQANQILGEVQGSLKRVDAILSDAQVVSGNVKAASADLGALRAEVEASLRKVSALIDEINRKWPFQRDTQIKLP